MLGVASGPVNSWLVNEARGDLRRSSGSGNILRPRASREGPFLLTLNRSGRMLL